jgi:hypothetical protein
LTCSRRFSDVDQFLDRLTPESAGAGSRDPHNARRTSSAGDLKRARASGHGGRLIGGSEYRRRDRIALAEFVS